MKELDPEVWKGLREDLAHVQREVLSEVAHIPEAPEYTKRLRWYAGFSRELDRIIGMAKGKRISLAEHLAGRLPVKDVYSEAAKESVGQLHVVMPRLPVKAIEFLEENGLTNMEGLASDLRTKLKQQVQAGMLRQESTRQIADRLTAARVVRGRGVPRGRLSRGVFPSVARRARLIAQDQLAHAHLQGRALVYQDEGVTVVKIIGKTTACEELCKPYVGTEMPLEEAMRMYPRHLRCMCDWVAAERAGRRLIPG